MPPTKIPSPLAPERAGMRCDFCGEEAPTVRRVALDHDYERLLTPHKERFACAKCSAAKEAARKVR